MKCSELSEKNLNSRKSSEYKSRWEQIKEIINSKEIGEIITRQELLKNQSTGIRNYTVDYYRNLLSKVNILTPTKKLGCYRIVQKIPEELTSTKLLELSEDDRTINLLTKIEDRL